MKAKAQEIPISTCKPANKCREAVSSLCLSRQLSSVLSRDRWKQTRTDPCEASFVGANSWQRNCLDVAN